jgi:hypothetical protein
MKNFLLAALVLKIIKPLHFYLAFLAFVVSCTKRSRDISSDSIGGRGDLPVNVPGHTYSCHTTLPGVKSGEIKVIACDKNGVGTLSVKAVLPMPGTMLTALLPPAYKDASGNLSATIKFKNTSQGIVDYLNVDSKPFVIVNYASNVGDKYVLNTSRGETVIRTVTAKSAIADYPYGLMLIKTIIVEQASSTPGINKIRYIANPKYGLVAVEWITWDGNVTKLSIM